MHGLIVPGALVRHPQEPDWGVGQVQSVVGDRVTVNFENAGKRLINAAMVDLTVVESDPAGRRADPPDYGVRAAILLRSAMTIQTKSEAADRQRLLAGIRHIALEAGRDILRHYAEHKAGGIDIRQKDDASPVTVADEEAEAIILSGLAELTPDIPAISEEGFARGETPRLGRRFWLVDPLDGTKEFLNRNGEFTVNIALIEDGMPVLGVVYAPAKGRLCFGAVPDAAFEQDIDPATGAESAPRPLRVRAPGPDGLVVVASRTHRSQKTDEYLAAYPIKDFVVAGSSLKLCLIAAGEADLYPRHGDTMEWDIAAGHAVLRAAGGEVTDLEGKPLTYGKSSLLNPWFIARGDLPFTAPRR